MKKGLSVFFLVVLFVSIYYMMGGGRSGDSSAVQGENVVVLPDQASDSDVYVVSYAKLSRPGYVLIYAWDEAGVRHVVGRSALLAAGEHTNVYIAKFEGVSVGAGASIEAAIVADNGDGVYDASTDTEVLFGGTGEAKAKVYESTKSADDSSSDEQSQQPAGSGYTAPTSSTTTPVTPPTAPADSTKKSTTKKSKGSTGGYVAEQMPKGTMMEPNEAPQP